MGGAALGGAVLRCSPLFGGAVFFFFLLVVLSVSLSFVGGVAF